LKKWAWYKLISLCTLSFMLCEPTLALFFYLDPQSEPAYLQTCVCLLKILEERTFGVLVCAQFFFWWGPSDFLWGLDLIAEMTAHIVNCLLSPWSSSWLLVSISRDRWIGHLRHDSNIDDSNMISVTMTPARFRRPHHSCEISTTTWLRWDFVIVAMTTMGWRLMVNNGFTQKSWIIILGSIYHIKNEENKYIIHIPCVKYTHKGVYL